MHPCLDRATGACIPRTTTSILVAPLLALFGGCAGLLPSGRADEPSTFATFEDARASIERVEPQRTRLQDMKALGLDPEASSNVREIPYPQFVGVLFASSAVDLSAQEPGIRECVAAGARCRAYQFRFSRVYRERNGDFVMDFLNFDRTTRTTGWRFEAVVLVRDDGVVLFRNHAGEPRIDLTERVRNPLGPFQSIDALRR